MSKTDDGLETVSHAEETLTLIRRLAQQVKDMPRDQALDLMRLLEAVHYAAVFAVRGENTVDHGLYLEDVALVDGVRAQLAAWHDLDRLTEAQIEERFRPCGPSEPARLQTAPSQLDLRPDTQRYCVHCQKWIDTEGVMRSLRFIAEHDSRACVLAADQEEAS